MGFLFQHKFISIILTVLLLGGGYFFVQNIISPSSEDQNTENSNTSIEDTTKDSSASENSDPSTDQINTSSTQNSPALSSSCPSSSMSFGIRSAEVKILQNYLIQEKVLASHLNTGFFGPLTTKALEQLKAEKNITCPGIDLGAATLAAASFVPTHTQEAPQTEVKKKKKRGGKGSGGGTGNGGGTSDSDNGEDEDPAFQAPALTTEAVTNLTSSIATLNAELTAIGNANSVEVYFEYGINDFSSSTTPETLNAPGTFDFDITDLTSNTTYQVRAVVEYENEGTHTITSNEVEFTTEESGIDLLRMAEDQRVDFVMMGDSNQLMNGNGFDHGLGKALAVEYGLYATPLYSQQAGGTAFGNQGFSSTAISGATGTTTGAPSIFNDYALANAESSLEYLYQASGAIGNSNGLLISLVSNGLNTSGNLRTWFSYGTFDTGSGSFRPSYRQGSSPYTGILYGDVISTSTGALGVEIGHLDLPAAARDYPVQFQWQRAGGTASVGPTIEFWQRAEDLDVTTGISTSSLYGAGGNSLYDFASFIINRSDDRLTHYFEAIRHLQLEKNQDPVVVVYINSGLNDRNETSQPSLGPNPSTDADSPEAYKDNLEAIVNRIEEIWEINDWDLDNLGFVVVPSHPVSNPDDSELVSYRDIAEEYANSRDRLSVIDISELITSDEILSSNYYQSGGSDKNHLTIEGYEEIGSRIVNSIAE